MNLFTTPAAARTLRAAFVVFLFTFGSAVFAAEAPKKAFDVPAGDAAETLKVFSEQSGQTVVYLLDNVRGAKTTAVKGDLAPRAALNQMLSSTDLMLVEDKVTGALSVTKTAANAKNAPSRLADATAANAGLPEGSVDARQKESVVELDTFEVFGSKSINSDIPRTRNDVQPYVVFAREQLQSSPAANLEDFFRTRLPMNQVGSTTASSNAGATSTINLRGLGANQTLILLDGRRLPPRAGVGGQTSQADVNGIPLSMIERIEILPSTASGIYGGGATGGVINIITRKDYSGVEVTATYQNTFKTDVASRRIDVNGSFQLEQGKTMVTFNYSHTDNNEYLMQDRDFAARSRALYFRNNAQASTTPPAGYLANIRSQNGSNLVLKNGTALNSPITFVPVGYAGPASDGGAALVPNAGRYNLDIPNATFGGLRTFQSTPTLEAYGVSLRRSIGSRVEVYADASRATNDTKRGLFGASTTTTTISATAPNNPFTTPITVNYPSLDNSAAAQTGEYTSQSDRLAVGMFVRLPADWVAGVDYVYARSESGYVQPFSLLGDPDGTGPGLSYATALSTGVLDVLRDLYTRPLDLGAYYMPDPFTRVPAELRSDEWTVRASGPLLQLPAGPMTLSASVQERKEKIPDFVQTASSTSTPIPSYRFQPNVGSSARAYYAELRVPVFGSVAGRTFGSGLELQASVRRDDLDARTRASTLLINLPSPSGPFPNVDYITRKFSATKATVGAKFAITQDLSMRASFGNGYLPPTLSQLAPSGGAGSANLPIVDPKRGNTTSVLRLATIAGGNPFLLPEESESTSAGVVFTPRFAPGFRLSVDYSRIVKTNEIGSLLFQNLVNQEALFPDRVVRAPLTPADQALGYTGGVITQLDWSNQNLAGKRVEAWDVQADYTWKPANFGEFQAYALATYQPHFESQSLVTAPWIDNAGFNTGPLKWRGNGGLNWSRGAWMLGWNAQYYSNYLVYNASDAAATRASAVLNQGSETIPSQVYHDLNVSYRFGADPSGWRRMLAQSQLTIGVQNVFNTSPPVIASANPFFSSSAIAQNGDPLLRRYSISLRKKF